jgi:hypothetical protein
MSDHDMIAFLFWWSVIRIGIWVVAAVFKGIST